MVQSAEFGTSTAYAMGIKFEPVHPQPIPTPQPTCDTNLVIPSLAVISSGNLPQYLPKFELMTILVQNGGPQIILIRSYN